MDRRQLLTGMMASAFVAAVPVKAMAKLTTSVSPPMKRQFHVRYDSVALTYIKEVVGRTTPLPVVRNVKGVPLRREAWGQKPGEKYDPDATVDWYRRTVPPDLALAAYYLEAERNDRVHGNSGWMPADWNPDLS